MHTYLQSERQELLEMEMMMQKKPLDKIKKGVIFKNCAPFTKCISRKSNADTVAAQDIDTVKPVYNLTEYSDN